MFTSKGDDRGRLPGPDTILENIASGTTDDLASRSDSRSSSLTQEWTHAHPAAGTAVYAAQSGAADSRGSTDGDAHAPGIPLFLAQARNGSLNVTQMPMVYDSDNVMLPMGDIGAMLPDTNPLMQANGMPMYALSGVEQSSMYHHPIPQPNPTFVMAQQNALGEGYGNHYTDTQGQADEFNRRQGTR